MSVGGGLVGEAFEALGLPWRTVQRGAAVLVLGAAVLFPSAFREGITAYANHKAAQFWHQMQPYLPQPSPTPSSK